MNSSIKRAILAGVLVMTALSVTAEARIALNRIAFNRIALNSLKLNAGSDGAFSRVIAIELPEDAAAR